ncbi:MAG: aminotransferase class I/II-fold pyridoxal phosphate-dependent enzyme [Bacteroidota bacterium]|nr:aminotransferase class I/II-fold pyridoxal phosphate-dependent enzyme [Bacteroidota bacterium]
MSLFKQQQRSSIHLGEQFIVTNSLTKVYGLSGLRCGWILAEPKLIKKMWYLNDLFEVAPPHPSVCLSVVAFRYIDRIKRWSKSILDNNHKLLIEFLDSYDGLKTILPGYGTTVFPLFKKGNAEELYTVLYKKYNTAITPGRFFEMPEHFRIGLGCDSNTFEIGLRNIGKAYYVYL